MKNILAVNGVEITFAERQIINGIEQIGFARTIVTGKTVGSFIEQELRLMIVFKVDNA
jgi:hypothetical protein